jgi:hypothetical protein
MLDVEYDDEKKPINLAVAHDRGARGGMEVVWSELEKITRKSIPQGSPTSAYHQHVREAVYQLEDHIRDISFEGQTLVPAGELERIFNFTFESALRMLEEFCNGERTLDMIFLVGGAATSNDYLKKRFLGKCGEIPHHVVDSKDAS